VHEIRPLIPGKLDGGNRGDDLGRRLAGLGIGGTECLKRQLLDARLRLLVGLVEPFRL
jgi:hypothetical protein